MKPELSVVIPVYYGESFILELHSRLQKVFDKLEINYEILFVNDASLEKIKKIASADDKVIGLNLSRNFGQHATILAGLTHAN